MARGFAPHFSAEGMKDRADLAVEALKLTLGDGVDYEKMREEFARDFAKIANANGECGETYPRTPLGWVAGKALTLEAMCAMNDSILSKDGSRYPHAYPFDQPEGDISRRIWTPELGGYSFEQMNRLALPDQPEDPQARTIHARMALLNPEMPKAKEPLLHFTDQTYEQQLESVGDFSRKYGEDHPELAVHGMPAIDFAMLVRQRRIEGKPMPVEWGYMRTIQMGR
ncbi:hypothetical protein CR969_03310, partial [Candidatus Saccharibacteria bacterium]